MSIWQDILRAVFGAAPMQRVDVTAMLEKRAAGKDLNWRTSIVDLLKLLDLDSSIGARKRLAKQLDYEGTGAPGSAEWNIGLHRAVMRALEERRLS